MHEFKLGDRVIDEISGYAGIITSIANYIDGDVQMQVTREGHVTPEGKTGWAWFHPNRLMPVAN